MASTDYDRFTAFAQTFSASRPQTAISGDYYDQPGIIVYHQAAQQLPDGGRVEVNTITPATPQEFAWEVEITINDKQGSRFVHLLLQRDHEVVETYGKTIIPVGAGRTAAVFDLLDELSAG